MAEANTSAMRFIVHGRVQGVGYRAATQRQALAFGLVGWVRNRGDGCVEGIATGRPQALGALRRWLGEGPAAAAVTCVEWLPADAEGSAGFAVLA